MVALDDGSLMPDPVWEVRDGKLTFTDFVPGRHVPVHVVPEQFVLMSLSLMMLLMIEVLGCRSSVSCIQKLGAD